VIEVEAHGLCGGGGVSGEDGAENFCVIGDGFVFRDAAVAVLEAGLQEIGKGLHEQGADLVAGGLGDQAVELHVGEHLSFEVLTGF